MANTPPNQDDINNAASWRGEVEQATEDFIRGQQATGKIKDNLFGMVNQADNLREAMTDFAQIMRGLHRSALQNTKDAQAYKSFLDQSVEAMKKLHDHSVGNKTMQKALNAEMERAKKLISEIGDKTGDLEDGIRNGVLKAASDWYKKTADTKKLIEGITLGHVERQARSITSVLSGIGVGGKLHEKMMSHTQRVEDFKEKVIEARRLRKEGNQAAFEKKRQEATDVAGKIPGFEGMSDEDKVSALRKSGIGRSRARMFTKAGGTPEAETELAEHGEGFGGMLSKASEGLEGVALEGAELASGFGEVLLVVDLVKDALAGIWKFYKQMVKENQQMEAGLARGGLTAGQGGGALGFSQARAALRP